MALPASGTISLNDIKTEFGGGNNLTDYYRNGSYVPDYAQNSGVPTSGTIDLQDFYGASDVAPAQVYNPTGNNIQITSTTLVNQGFSSAFPVTININSQSYGTSTGNYALYINNLSAWTVTVNINALLRGDGGNGGNSSNGSGGAGGHALLIHTSNTSSKLTIYNNSTIYAGGGGGGGGARYSVSDYRTAGTTKDGYTCNFTATRYRGGGGGGGGRGYSSSGGASTTSTDGCSGYGHGAAGGAGTTGTNGAGGGAGYTYYQPTSGTGSCPSCRIAYGGAGGAGGAIGAAGSAGASGAAGARGYAVLNRNHASWPSGYGSYVGSVSA